MNKGSHGYVVVRPAGCPTQLTSDRPSVDAEGQSWCGACESIEGPWRMNKAWMTHAPAVGFLAATVVPITARARDPSSPAHETQPAIQACTAELPATARWSQRRHPSHPPAATPASNIQLSSIICPPACLFLSLHGLRRVTEYFGQDGPEHCVSTSWLSMSRVVLAGTSSLAGSQSRCGLNHQQPPTPNPPPRTCL